jgi:FMN reductase
MPRPEVSRSDPRPLVVGIGGSNRSTSLTDQLLRTTLAEVDALGARTVHFGGAFLNSLPVYGVHDDPATDGAAAELIRTVAAADGLVIGTPGYHGGMSGLVKNGLDHLEALRDDPRPYLDGRAVGVVVTAAGWQATGTTVVAVRSTIHALRGWPTPFAAAVNSAEPAFAADGALTERVAGAVRIVATQVVDFARWRRAADG